jgi:hypothetical protein
MTKATPVQLECANCGGQTELSPDGVSARCLFCRSVQLIQQPTAQFERLKDYPDASFSMTHAAPKVELSALKGKVLDLIKSDPIGLRNAESLDMSVEGTFMPIWLVAVAARSTWRGKYSETRTVTRYREVSRYRTVTKTRYDGQPYEDKEEYTVQEPYEDKEIIWHPTTGIHEFDTSFQLPAIADKEKEARFLLLAFSPRECASGAPIIGKDYCMLSPVLSQRGMWDKCKCQELLTTQGNTECRNCVEQLEHASTRVERVQFTLAFLPCATVSYKNGVRRYTHYFDLQTGRHFGDAIPLDYGSIDKGSLAAEAKAAFDLQEQIKRKHEAAEAEINVVKGKKNLALLKWACLFVIPLLSAMAGFGGFATFAFWASLICFGYQFFTTKSKTDATEAEIRSRLPKETPWKEFLTKRGKDLIHLARIEYDQLEWIADAPPDAQPHYNEISRLGRLVRGDVSAFLEDAERIGTSLAKGESIARTASAPPLPPSTLPKT